MSPGLRRRDSDFQSCPTVRRRLASRMHRTRHAHRGSSAGSPAHRSRSKQILVPRISIVSPSMTDARPTIDRSEISRGCRRPDGGDNIVPRFAHRIPEVRPYADQTKARDATKDDQASQARRASKQAASQRRFRVGHESISPEDCVGDLLHAGNGSLLVSGRKSTSGSATGATGSPQYSLSKKIRGSSRHPRPCRRAPSRPW